MRAGNDNQGFLEAQHRVDEWISQFEEGYWPPLANLARLVEEGLSEDQLSDEGVRTYLRWRGRITVAQRMDDLGAEADIRMERDPVLSEAVRLLLNSTTQVQLFEAAEAEQARRDEGTGEL